MRKFLFVALAVVATACSDPIAYEGTPEPPPCPSCTPQHNAILTTGGTSAVVVGGTDFTGVRPVAASSVQFTGLLDRNDYIEVSNASLSTTTPRTLTFTFYALGSWDGSGKQAQHGNFVDETNFKTSGDGVFVFCGTGPNSLKYGTTFSNQKTVSQHYPNQIGAKTAKAGSGSAGYGTLGFDKRFVTGNYGPAFEAWIPLFQSVGDSYYNIEVNNLPGDCSPRIEVSLDQPLSDEGWGISDIALHQ